MARTLDTVFLSSTAMDLTAFRDAVWLRLTNTGVFHCVRMETFGPQDTSAVEHCRGGVCAADIFVGIIGHRRGWEPFGSDSNDPRSITEMEHDWAHEARVRRFLWVAPDSFPQPADQREPDALHARQTTFRARIRDGKTGIVSHDGFGAPALLASEIVEHLLKLKLAQAMVAQAKPAEGRGIDTSRAETEAGVAAALDALADAGDIDLLALAQDPTAAKPADLEDKLRARAEAMEAKARPLVEQGRKGLAESAATWRHIGALAFLHDTAKALAAYDKAVALDPDNAGGLRFLGELHMRCGDLAGADKAFEQLLGVGLRTNDRKVEAMACTRLGWALLTRGDLAGAEEMQTEALRISEAIGWMEGVARATGNLGLIHQTRGDLDKAEEMQVKALALNEELGSKDGLARATGNLGVIHQTRGDLDRAEEMQVKALALNEDLGRKEGMADAYSNLGNIYFARGDLDHAEEMHLKSLALSEELGRKEGMARVTGNLGNIHFTRGDLDKAEEMQLKALALNEELGSKEGMAASYANLGNIHQTRGDLDHAEEMQVKALALNEELGRKVGMAAAYGNLGIIHDTRGDLDKAEEMQIKALALNEELRSKQCMARACWNLAIIRQQRRDIPGACAYIRRARDLYRDMGLAKDAADADAWLRHLGCPE